MVHQSLALRVGYKNHTEDDDHLLWKQVERLHEEKGVFGAGLLIGSVLEYQIGAWDSWLAYRVETFIEQGLLEIAEEAEDGWIYQTKLRKV